MMMRHALVFVFVLAIACVSGTAEVEDSAFDGIFEHYEAIRQALIEDSTEEVAKHAAEIAEITSDLRWDFTPSRAGVDSQSARTLEDLLPQIEERAAAVASAVSLEETRDRMAELTKPLVRWHELIQGSKPVVAYCPMVKKAWLQPDEPIGNPYAPYMLRCGEVVQR
jgi:hypothetical protein